LEAVRICNARMRAASAFEERQTLKIQVAAREERVEAILRLAARSWRVLPCAERGKMPLIRNWQRRASCDAKVIHEWTQKYVRCNWGVCCGSESDLIVLDSDGEQGLSALVDFERRGCALPQTLISRTGRGVHFFFQLLNGAKVRNSAGKLAPGLDVRGDGGYVIVPPSVHKNGNAYEFLDENNAVACAPEWLLEMISRQGKRPAIPAAEIGILHEGRRNDGLTRLAGAMRRKGATEAELQTALSEANLRRCRPPLEESEVSTIAASIARYPVGGPDPLESAWQAIQGEAYPSNYERFLALARQLQLARHDQTIALPLQRISLLMGVHWSTVGLHRRRAVTGGLLQPAGQYVAHRRAGLYRFSLGETLTKTLTTLTNGLARVSETSPSENPLLRVSTDSPSESEKPLVRANRDDFCYISRRL
jgi:hypothetical protein